MEAVRHGIPVTDTGTLGVFYLKRFWRGRLDMLEHGGQRHGISDDENLDRILLDGLGLGINDPDLFILGNRPSFEAFERWIVDYLGGVPAPETVARVNRLVTGYLEGSRNDYPMTARLDEPVLSAEEMAFWEGNGYVIVRDAVSREDAREAELAVWEFLGKDPARPEAWYDGTEHNFWASVFRHPALNRNRDSKRIHKAFAQIWGTEELLVSVDRSSLNLPDRGDNVDRSGPAQLHWDTSIVQPIAFGVLGILYLTDTSEEQGAFRCVPGFHRRIGAWLDSLPAGTDPRSKVLELEPESVPVAAGAGDLIIWRQELPHGSSRNFADYPRVAQYIRMYPPDYPVNPVWG